MRRLLNWFASLFRSVPQQTWQVEFTEITETNGGITTCCSQTSQRFAHLYDTWRERHSEQLASMLVDISHTSIGHRQISCDFRECLETPMNT